MDEVAQGRWDESAKIGHEVNNVWKTDKNVSEKCMPFIMEEMIHTVEHSNYILDSQKRYLFLI
jgi:hypothetical protein